MTFKQVWKHIVGLREKDNEIVAAVMELREMYSTRITELEIQSRFALSLMRVAKPPSASVILTGDGKPQIEIHDGWTIYTRHGGREKTLEILECEFKEAYEGATDLEIIRQRDGAEDGSGGSGESERRESDGRSNPQQRALPLAADAAQA